MLITIIVFIIVLGILVFVHELGHFYTARKLGVGVEEFGLGFPPKLFSVKKDGIIYSINAIPIGGFVKIKGESGDNENDPDSFINAPIWKRLIILFAGVFMNWILAFILISIGFMIGLPSMIDNPKDSSQIKNERVQIISVYDNSSAYNAGLKTGDFINSVDGIKFNSAEDLQKYLKEKNNSQLNFSVTRGKENINTSITPTAIKESGERKVVGIEMISSGIVSYPWYRAIYQGFITTASITYEIIKALGSLIADLFNGKGSSDVSGPIGVAVFTGKAVHMGWIYVLQFMALLSINLAIINIVPFPALDGGRILFLIIEKIRGKKNNQKVEAIVHNIGFSLLMILIILVTVKDFDRYGGKIISVFKNIF